MKHFSLPISVVRFLCIPAIVLSLLLAGCEPALQTEFSSAEQDTLIRSKQDTPAHDKNKNTRTGKNFDNYTDTLFHSMVAADSLTFHYTISDASSFQANGSSGLFSRKTGIKEPDATFGNIPTNSAKSMLAFYENMENALTQFPKEKLSDSQQLTYDTLQSYLTSRKKLAPLFLYEEYLSPLNGMQLEIPVLLAEYQFQSSDDIEYYLSLITTFPQYISQIIRFEEEKAAAGLFMSKTAFLKVLSQCDSFIEADSSHFMYTTFIRRMEEADFLKKDQKNKYISQHEKLLQNYFFPSYKLLKEHLAPLASCCRNEGGLCFLPSGRQYYEIQMQYTTGTEYSIAELQQALERSRQDTLQKAAQLLAEHPDLALKATESPSLTVSVPEDMLTQLIQKMQEDFRLDTVYPYRLEYIDSSLEESMAPAFYLTAPLDDLEHNVIYLNSSSNMDGLDLFTTLAHEGYPGHLYQNAVLKSSDVCYLRQLLSFPGYSEGWATYAELFSYDYTGLDGSLAEYYRLNRILLLGMYASMEIGIHYEGWDIDQLNEFLVQNGLSPDESSLASLYELVEQNAGGYLKYFVGYLEIESLRQYAKELYGNEFSNLAFHDALLNMGPAPFPLLKEYLPSYWQRSSEASSNS